MKQEFTTWYNKNYKKLLVLPSILLALSIIYLGFFYIQNNDIIHKDVSLTGGTTITIFTDASLSELEQELSSEFPNLIVRGLSDNTGKQDKVIITVPDDPEKLQSALENYLGFELDEKNSSIEFTGSSLSEDFYQQLLLAVTFAFLLMALVVFIIFAKKFKIKLLAVLLTLVSFGFYLIPELISPGWIASTWNFHMFSGILLFKIPIEEFIWYFISGLLIGPLYEYWKDEQINKSKLEKEVDKEIINSRRFIKKEIEIERNNLGLKKRKK